MSQTCNGAGINSIMFYAPVIFKTISSNGALLSTVITGVINVVTTFVSIATVDKIGRKVCTYPAQLALTILEKIVAATEGSDQPFKLLTSFSHTFLRSSTCMEAFGLFAVISRCCNFMHRALVRQVMGEHDLSIHAGLVL